MTGALKMTVDVSLCGSIPRSEMGCSRNMRLPLPQDTKRKNLSISGRTCVRSADSVVSMAASSLLEEPIQRSISSSQVIDPPSWAVPARGEAKLEPICESVNLQSAVDLTSKAVFRIGRSQNSDVQLLHCTSSRRHALLFHHPNGSCYIVDCGSAHGTYVNGIRVKTSQIHPAVPGSSRATGMILPHRVKKGALVRFGGPGAPTFILKSFSVGFDSLLQNFEQTRTNVVVKEHDTPITTCQETTEYSVDALVRLNTRINATGTVSTSKQRELKIATARLYSKMQPSPSFSFLKKRTVVSFDDDSDIEQEMHCQKKLKLTKDDNRGTDLPSDVAIVSPSRQKPVLYFDFDVERPVVSPTFDEFQSSMGLDNEHHQKKSNLINPLLLPSTRKKTKRVIFSDKPPELFYNPISVTPEASSDEE